MARFTFTVSPDFDPDKIAGWYIFNTWLQRHLKETIHLELYPDFDALHRAIDDGSIDLIYANPYDATKLVRERGCLPVARPIDRQDEAAVIVRADHSAQQVEDLEPGSRIACTDDPDVNMIGMIMLEPAELSHDNIERITRPNHLLVAKTLIKGEADAGFILKEAFDDFSGLLKNQLRPLVVSAIRDIAHALLVGPRLRERHQELQQLLPAMAQDAKGAEVLTALGFEGWEVVDTEEMEFMIDLMDTLSS